MILYGPQIRFPGLGIEIGTLKNSITLPNGFDIRFYGIIIGIGILAGYFLACHLAKKDDISSDTITDFLLYTLVFSIIGARLYYVIFEWSYYSKNPLEIINIRGGGLAIYGGVIASIITLFVFTRVRNLSFFKIADCCIPGLVIGQIIGRWGNFFNCEAFGGYYDGPLSMWILKSKVYSGYITKELSEKAVVYDGSTYICVHPTFLYESLWNCGVLVILLLVNKYKKFDGQVLFGYFILYGIGRMWIEGLRTDQLIIGSTGLPVSQLLSGILIVSGILLTFFYPKYFAREK